jgi:hypothetical protein
MRLSSVEPPRARASGLQSPTLVPFTVLPCRSIAPLAWSIASARQVLPAPAGPISAMALVPLTTLCMRVSLSHRGAEQGRGTKGTAPLRATRGTTSLCLSVPLGKRERACRRIGWAQQDDEERNELMATAAAQPDLGRSADKPSEIPPQGWFAIAKRTWTEVQKDNVGIVAAGVAFYFFLALVPLLAAAVLTYGCSPSLPLSHGRRRA